MYFYNREDNDYEEETYCFIGLPGNGNDANAEIKLFNKEIKTDFAHNEVKTFKGNDKVNMIEW